VTFSNEAKNVKGMRSSQWYTRDTDKVSIALHGKPISELWDVTCHMESHSVTCHQTQVNAPRLYPSQ